MNSNPVPQPAAPPWWKFGYVWMLVAGPAAVVLAGFATLWLALANPETLVAEDYYRRGVGINRELTGRKPEALAPAVQARNHAATPSIPQPSR